MILIVSSQFNKVSGISASLEESATAVLKTNNMNYKLVQVPGAIEIPITVQHFLKSGKYQAAITLGCVIKGETDHYEMVIKSCTEGLSRVSLDLEIPVIQGVLVSPNDELAISRKNLGKEYAETALKMIEILN
ncbi:6,7-dimethyl-8-ribityllumazine synthase [Candidatus Harpocratesius sp.]